MNTITHTKSVAAKQFTSRANTLSVKQSAKGNLLLSIWQALFGKSTGHAFSKIAGLFLVGILSIQQSSAQQLVDNFTRSNSNTVGGGWSEDESNGSSYCSINTNRLQIGGNTDDADFIYRDASSLFNTTYSTNTALMTWQFNMRQNDATPNGFDGNSAGGMAYVLGGNNSSFTAGQGYAVIFGSSSNTDVVRLVHFNNGVDADGNFSTIVNGTTDYSTEYFAVRVTYNPATTQWSLYLNVNASSFNDPNTAVYTLIGQANNTTYTAQNLNYTGCFYKHGSSGDLAYFDNVWVPTSAPVIITQPAATINSCNGSSVTFTANANFDTGRQWEKLISGVWTAIGGATNDSYTINPASPADAGDYRVVYTNAIGTATSSVSTLAVGTPSVGGTVDFSMTVCTGQNNSTLNLSGHAGSVTRWESSTNGGSSWSTIANTTTSYTYTNISQTTMFRAVVTNGGCASSNSTPATITVVQPALFSVTGGGSFCAGGGANVGLSGSETGVDYQLMNGVTPVGSPIPGTGNAISFGLQTATGTYTVIAIHNAYLCVRTMTGSANLVSLPVPSATATASNNLICGTGTTTLTSTGASNTTALKNFASGTLNLGFTNTSFVTDTITVYDAPTSMAAVTSFSVTVNITHTYDSDVEIYLVRPGGILTAAANGNYTQTISTGGSVCLSADAGGSGNNYTSTVFSSLGTQTCVANGSSPFTGTFLPENAFSTLTGDPNGVWTLKVVDDAAQDNGTLLNWTITMNTISGVTYTWTSSPSGFSSSVQNPGIISPTISRDYIVTVTGNGNGCTTSASTGVVNVSPAMTASCGIVNNESCVGANDGSINVTVSGGTAPYTGTGTIAGLGAGLHTFTVTDALGCTSTCSSTIVVADATAPVISGCPTNFTVNSDPGQCGAIVTWIEPTVTDNCSVDFFSSNYYNGDLFSIGLNSVTYIAQDPSGNQSLCFFDVTVIDAEPPVITCPADIVVNSTSGICGAAVTFAATATDNCSAVLSYSPASGSIFPVGTTLVTATATDPEGNTDICTFNVTVNDTEFPAFTGCPSNIVIGTNGSCDRIVTWTPPVATDNCSGVSSSSNYNPGDVFPMGTTIVTYTAVDGAGNTTICTFDVTVEDHENPVVSCPGDMTITANAAGCSAIATFSATVTDNCSATLSYSHVSGSAFSGTTPVTVTATDPSGNTSSCTFNVIVVNDLVASSSSTAILCNGGSATVTITATGGTSPYTGEGSFTVTAGTYTYTVTDANGCSSSTTITVSEPAVLAASSSSSGVLCNGGSATVTVSATGGTAPYSGDGSFTVTAGTYNYTVTDANGCTSNTSITVTEPAILSASSVQGSAILCNGGTTTVTVSATGGTTPYSGEGTFTVGAGTHNYTITDANGCTANTSITVSEPTALVATSIQGADILCNGGTTTVTVSATGGTAPYTGEGTFTVSAGLNTFTVTDANGCTGNTSITVSEPTALVASATSTTILCNGGSATVTVSATGGTAPYSGEGSFTVTAGTYNYTVTDANGCSSNTSITVTEPASFVASSSATAILCNGGTAIVTVSTSGGTAPFTGDGTFTVTAGTYNYTVTDAGGCTSNTSITISEPTALVASSSQGAAILCNGGSTTITVSATGGTAPYSGDGTFAVTAGTHNYTVTDANGCTSNTSVTVTEPTAVVVSATQGASILCNGGSTTVTVSATGGTSPYSGEGTFTVTAGTYNYTVTDANGCTSNTSITVSEPAALVASSSSTAILCNGGSATVTVSATGGTAPYSGDGSFTVTAGTYNYTVTDANGCTSNTSITVTEPTALVASSSSTAILCNGGTSTITVSATGGTAPYSGDGSFTVTAGTYNYTVTDANGCTSNTSITVSEPTALVATSTQGAAILCNGGSTSVTVSVTGGTAPYSGDGTFTVTAGTYNYTVTDANGCTSNTSITVSEPSVLVASSSSTAILCNGGSATITVSATGGTAPYSGDGSFTVTAGTYNYTVTDANGCTSNTSITVSEPTVLTASSSATAILCNGGSATVTVSATGGTAPYSGDGSFTVTAGTYSYTVTDANGCTSNTSITISEPTALVASSTQGAAILCNGGSTTVTVSATGGTAPYSGDGTFTVTAGTYNYTVTDANGCTSNTSITVSEPSALVASSSSSAILCNGGSATVTVSVTGGTAPYSGDGSFTVTAGTYNYTVTDANGCTSNTSITVSEPTALTASSSSTAILCNGGSATVTVSATGGTTPYSGDGTFTVTAGTYNYTVTDANGCTSNTSITVSEPSALVASSTQGAAILCNGGSTTVTVSATGGTAPYSGDGTFTVTAGTYNYTVTDANGCTSNTSITVSEPAALVASSSSTAILCNGGSATVTVSATGGTTPYSGDGSFTVTAGTYNYTVTDANGCTSNTSITVSEPAVLSASATSTDASCLACADGTATVSSITGGTAPYTVTPTSPATGLLTGNFCFTITDANGCSTTACTFVDYIACNITASAVETSPVLCNGGTATVVVSAIGGTAPITGEGTFTVLAGTHSYTVTDVNGCPATTTITISEPAALVASSSQGAAILCNGGSTTVTVSATGGTAPYSGDGSFTVTAGTYNYTVTDANGCTSNTSITVSEPTALTASSSSTAILCNGGSATVTVSATGGTAPYSGDGSFMVTAGTYNYTVTDANGCTSNTSITVTEPSALVASSSSTAILCNGGSATVTVSATGGTAPYSGDGSFTVTAGTYNYTVTDANGCTSNTSITVSEPTALTASSSATAILCNGGSATVTVSATGGTAPYSGEGTFTVTAGTYNYTVTDANGCTSNTSITVTEPSALVASSSSTAILCNGGSATVTVSVTGGTAPYSGDGSFTVTAGTYNYTVTDANGCTSNTSITVSEPTALTASSSATAILCNGGSATVTVSAIGGTAPYSGDGTFTVTAGTYNYTVTDANGCTSNTSITVSEPTALTASSSATSILCNGGSATVTVSATGGTAPYSGDGSFTVTAGTYNYTVTDANGCTSNTSITVSEPTALTASSSATAILCNGGSATVTVSATGGTAPYSGDGSFTVTAGTYNYTVTDANGCTSNTSITVSEPTALTASSSSTAILCNGGSATVTVSATGGTAPYSGDGSFTVTAGTYNYTVTDANGCTSNTSITVTEPSALVASSSSTAILCNGGSATVTVSATGGTAPYSGDGSFTVTAGTYNYTVTDANGCTSNTSITVTEPSALVASSSSTAILCNGGSATVTVSATGGTAPYSGDGSFTVTAGTYNYTVTDANGCTSNTSITVAEPSVLVASSSASTIDCIGGTTDVTVSATGGTAPYSGTGLFNEAVGTYTYTVTDANGCTATTTITLTQVDTQDPAFVGCPNNVTINTSGACTQTVNWIAPTATDNCSATVSTTHNPGDVFPIGTTTVTYTAVDPNGNSATCSFTVTVEDHENPVVTCPSNIAVNNDPGSCGAVVNFSASVSDNCSATLSYSHASGSLFPIGTTVVTVTGTDAAGNSSSCSFNVVVTDSEYPLLTACPADIVTCSPVVNWTAPTATDNCSVTVSSNINPGSTFSTGTTVVTYSAIDASGNTTTCSFNVTVNIPSTDPTSISSSTGNSMCNSGTTTLSVVGGSLGTGAQWVWYSGTCGGTPAGTGSSITVTPGATTSYFVRAEGGCANSNCASTTITVFTGIPSGVVNTINGAISVCPGSSGVYTVNAVSNTGTYVWSAPAGTLINGLPSPVSTTTNSATLTFGTLPIGQSGYNICVFASNPCGSTAAKCAWIRGDLSTPNFFTAPTVICAGTTVTYEVSALAGASSYIWSATGGATITGSGTSVQVTFPANYTTGSVCVAGQSPCGLTSAQRCVTVTSSPGLPGVITGPVTVCPGSTESYSIAAVNGAASYIWTAPAGASISGPSNGLSITVVYTAGFVSGQVTVKSVNTCGAQSGVRAKSVSTGKLPTPGNIVGDVTSGVCGQTYQYSIPSLANATLGYVWTIPAGVTVIGPSTSNSITLQFPASFVSGTLSVAGNNGCGLGYARSVNVYGNPATPGAISGNTSVCSGSVELYSWAPVPGTSYYQIQAPVGSTILSGNITTNTFVLIQWGTTGGNIGIKAINGCGVSGTRTLNASISCRTAAEQVMTDKLIVEAYPNPNRGQFSVSVDSKTDATYTLRILDQTGRILKTSVMNATEGLNVQEFDLEGIAAGMYVLRVETENREVINKSIIVQ